MRPQKKLWISTERMTEIKNSLEKINIRFVQAKERICKTED
jgi:hypothetical protein